MIRAIIKQWFRPTFWFALYLLFTLLTGTSICALRSTTGMPCPGCGLTTAGIALLKGDPAAAVKINAMILLVPPLLALTAMDICKKDPDFSKISRRIYLCAALIMVIYFVVRMILYFPDGSYPMNFDHNTIWYKVISLFRNGI